MSSNEFPSVDSVDAAQAPEPQSDAVQQDAAASSAGTAQGLDPLADLTRQLDAAKAEALAHYEAFLRAKADGENARRRALEDVAKARKFGVEAFAESLLPVMDSLEAALANSATDAAKLREGVELTLRQLQTAFERNQLQSIDPAGERFDPHRHQAISTQPVPGVEPNHVAAVLQKGWTLADRVLRPALVTVGQ